MEYRLIYYEGTVEKQCVKTTKSPMFRYWKDNSPKVQYVQELYGIITIMVDRPFELHEGKDNNNIWIYPASELTPVESSINEIAKDFNNIFVKVS